MFMLQGVEETCIWTSDKIKAIRELMQHTSQYVQAKLPKTYSWELVEALLELGEERGRMRDKVEIMVF